MGEITIITEQELREVVQLDSDIVSCIEECFAALAGGGVVMPPILRLDIEANNGEVDVKTAYVPGLDSFAIKVSPGFFDNPKVGLPSLNGLMVLFSAQTGVVEALLLDNGYLTAVRTAAAGAAAAKQLSRENAETAAILGAGVQGRLQLEALTLVRPIRKAVYWSPDGEKARQTAEEMATQLGIEVQATSTAQEAVRKADIIVTATPSSKPILRVDWLESGQHITAMGSDAEHKNELEPEIIKQADLYIPDSLSQVRRLGELHHAISTGLIDANTPFSELGAIFSGAAPGRTSSEEITVADLTGTGVQDTAIATLALSRTRKAGIGLNITT